MPLGGSHNDQEKLNTLLGKTNMTFKIRNKDGSLSKIQLYNSSWNLGRKSYPLDDQGYLDADYELDFILERVEKAFK